MEHKQRPVTTELESKSDTTRNRGINRPRAYSSSYFLKAAQQAGGAQQPRQLSDAELADKYVADVNEALSKDGDLIIALNKWAADTATGKMGHVAFNGANGRVRVSDLGGGTMVITFHEGADLLGGLPLLVYRNNAVQSEARSRTDFARLAVILGQVASGAQPPLSRLAALCAQKLPRLSDDEKKKAEEDLAKGAEEAMAAGAAGNIAGVIDNLVKQGEQRKQRSVEATPVQTGEGSTMVGSAIPDLALFKAWCEGKKGRVYEGRMAAVEIHRANIYPTSFVRVVTSRMGLEILRIDLSDPPVLWVDKKLSEMNQRFLYAMMQELSEDFPGFHVGNVRRAVFGGIFQQAATGVSALVQASKVNEPLYQSLAPEKANLPILPDGVRASSLVLTNQIEIAQRGIIQTTEAYREVTVVLRHEPTQTSIVMQLDASRDIARIVGEFTDNIWNSKQIDASQLVAHLFTGRGGETLWAVREALEKKRVRIGMSDVLTGDAQSIAVDAASGKIYRQASAPGQGNEQLRQQKNLEMYRMFNPAYLMPSSPNARLR